MIKDAESHADEDRRQRELAEARNVAENAAYQAEKQLDELGDKVDSQNKEEIEAAIKDVRDSLELRGRRRDQGSKSDALQAAFQKVSEQIYAQAAEQQAATSSRRRLAERRRRRGGGRGRRGRRRREDLVGGADD